MMHTERENSITLDVAVKLSADLNQEVENTCRSYKSNWPTRIQEERRPYMRKLFYMGLEPHEGRYTLQLEEWSRRAFNKRDLIGLVYLVQL